MQQRTKPSWRAPIAADKDLVRFESTGGKGYLSIYAPCGVILCRNEAACAAMGTAAHGVPSEETSLRLATQFLKKLEISERDLSKNADGSSLLSRSCN